MKGNTPIRLSVVIGIVAMACNASGARSVDEQAPDEEPEAAGEDSSAGLPDEYAKNLSGRRERFLRTTSSHRTTIISKSFDSAADSFLSGLLA
jgi:hypothetical protein